MVLRELEAVILFAAIVVAPLPASAQFYCAKQLTPADVSQMTASSQPSQPRPAVRSIHRSNFQKPPPGDLQLYAVFPRWSGGGDAWPSLPIKYVVDSSVSDRTADIAAAIEKWEKNTVVTFLRIDAKDTKGIVDYFTVLRKDEGCYVEAIGYVKDPKRQFINIDAKCKVGNIVHEIGHVLGLIHEHKRSDRDLYVKFDWVGINEALQGDEEALHRALRNYGYLADLWEEVKNWLFTDHVGDYDLMSVMQYPPVVEIGTIFATTEFGRQDLRARFGQADFATAIQKVGQRDCVSQFDADAINARYSGR